MIKSWFKTRKQENTANKEMFT